MEGQMSEEHFIVTCTRKWVAGVVLTCCNFLYIS